MKTIILELDNEDFEAVSRAVSIRQGFGGGGIIPPGGGNLVGRVVAEIARGWMETIVGPRDDGHAEGK